MLLVGDIPGCVADVHSTKWVTKIQIGLDVVSSPKVPNFAGTVCAASLCKGGIAPAGPGGF